MTEKMSGEHQQIYESIEAVRNEHGDITEAVNTVGSRMDRLERDLEIHMAEGHELYVQRTEIESMFGKFVSTVEEWLDESRKDRKRLNQSVGTLVAQQDVLAEVVLGKPERDIDNQIVRKGGLSQMIDDYTNGGVGFQAQLPDWFWAKLIGALTAVITLAGAILQVFG